MTTETIAQCREPALARLLQGIQWIDSRTEPSEALRVLRNRLVGELLGDVDRVGETLDPSFALLIQAGSQPQSMTREALLDSLRTAAVGGQIAWLEIDDLVVDRDTIALRGRMGNCRRGEATANITPVGAFIRFAGGRMIHETVFLNVAAAESVALGPEMPTAAQLHQLVLHADGATERRRGITIYRAAEAAGLFETGTMSIPSFDPGDQAALAADGKRSQNIAVGTHDAVLFRGAGDEGYSLVRAWFAPGFVLPRHTHDADCLYYVLEGEVQMGAQRLLAGDGFFVPAGAPYAYEAGPDGTTVLEFRRRTSFDMTIPGGQVERLRRMAEVADDQVARWSEMRADAGLG